MIKKKCLFIDHKYHSTTNSTHFLIEVLSYDYQVEVLFLEDFSPESFEKILVTSADLYLVFQYDFIAPFLLSNHKKVLIVPMYDGTGEMAPVHWLSMLDGLFLNFSEVLHKRHISLGLNSVYQKYYPDPQNYPRFSNLSSNQQSVFFWERQPVSGLSIDWLAHQINEQAFSPQRIHLHQSPDPGQYSKRHPSLVNEIFPSKKITTSTWFHNKTEFLQNLAKFSIYIAPRKAEGIGFSFIDAMACGMVVMAHDMPTMNEYVVHNVNGIIFDTNLPEFRSIDFEKLRARSISTFIEGHESWKKFIPQLLSKVSDYLEKPNKVVLRPMSPLMASQISNAFFRNQNVYAALIYNLVIDLPENAVWEERLSKPTAAARLSVSLPGSPVLNQVLLAIYSKRKKIL